MKKKWYLNRFLFVSLSLLVFLVSLFCGISIGFSNSANNVIIDSLPSLSFSYNTGGAENCGTRKSNSVSPYFEGKFTTQAGMCSDTPSNGSLTITNTSDTPINVKIVYSLTLANGTCKINGQTQNQDGVELDYVYENLNVNQSFKIELTSSRSANNSVTIFTLNQIYYYTNTPISVTFMTSENGTYSVDGSIISEELIISDKKDSDFFLLEASPNDGFTFLYWSINGIGVSQSQVLETNFKDGDIVYPVFVRTEIAAFKVGNYFTTDLEDALKYASEHNSSKTVEMIKNGLIDSNKRYVIEKNVILFVPNKVNADMYLDSNGMLNSNSSKPDKNPTTLFMNLELNNSIIDVATDGLLYIGGEQFVAGGSDTAYVSGTNINGYGQVSLDSSSQIILQSGAKLYCYGYIIGDGEVVANNGSEVHEIFQIGGFRGGTLTLDMYNNRQKVFVFNQYFIQNIESKLTVYFGAKQIVHGALFASSAINSTDVVFIASDSGLFRLQNEGDYISRIYDYKNDKIIYDLSGSALLSPISVSVAGTSVASDKYELPICNNMVINVKSGSQVTINQDLCLLPGAVINIEKDSELLFSEDKYLVVYDKDYWVNNNFAYQRDFYVIGYSASLGTKPVVRTNENQQDAELNINGTIYFKNNGCIYSTYDYDANTSTVTKGGAYIHSSEGTGKVIFETGLGDKTTTYQAIPNNKQNKYIPINIGPLLLQNGDNSYFIPNLYKDSIIDKTIYYDLNTDSWQIIETGNMVRNISFINRDTGEAIDKNYTIGEEFKFPSASELGFSSQYTLKGRSINDIYFYNPGETIRLSNIGNVNAYAIWGGWVNENGKEYYLDYFSGEKKTGLNRVENKNDNSKNNIYLFDENGNFDSKYKGVYLDENTNSHYLIIDGIVIEEPGFYKYEAEITSERKFEYIFIKNDSTILIDGAFYVDTVNDELPSGTYSFDSNGFLIRDDPNVFNSNGAVYIKGDTTYVDGVRVSYGLFAYNGYLYYSNSNCLVVKKSTHYVSITNGLYDEGLYYFDDEGHMCNEKLEVIKV